MAGIRAALILNTDYKRKASKCVEFEYVQLTTLTLKKKRLGTRDLGKGEKNQVLGMQK